MSEAEEFRCVLLDLAACDPELHEKVLELLHGRECPMMHLARGDRQNLEAIREARCALENSDKKFRIRKKGSEKLRHLAARTVTRGTRRPETGGVT